jgi:HSP20 family protein
MRTLYIVPRRNRMSPIRDRRIYAYQPVGFNGGRRLPVDVQVDEEGYSITAPVPGLKADDLRIEILDDVLTLHTHVEEEENGHQQELLREWYRGPRTRKLRLPDPVNASEAEARVEDGILSLYLPKTEEARPKKIKVKAR